MEKKVILISIDGMRADGLQQCGNPYVKELEKICAYTYHAKAVDPSVTLPCHYSMTHGVSPQRHGILTNTYVPEVRPVASIFDRVKNSEGTTAMFYGWSPLRDVSRPTAIKFATLIDHDMTDDTDTLLTDEALVNIEKYRTDFVFLYMVETDAAGHNFGWMSEEYLKTVSKAIDNVKRVIEKYGDEYTVIIGADHGGHDRLHGTAMDEDMTIPFFFKGKDFTIGELEKEVTLIDISPTIAKVMNIIPSPYWEGTPVF